jgi:DNA-binding NarL/FixJ family response regulator
MSRIRVVLADDHTLVRAGIRALLLAMDGLEIVGEADNGRDAVALAASAHPDLVIMDISMRELNGIEAAAQINAHHPGMRILMLSMHTTDDFVRRALRAGARGYLVKDSAPLELRMAVEAIMREETYLSSRVSRELVAGMFGSGPRETASGIDSLTPRQREILQLIAEGKSTKEIAFTLSVSVKTVETHRAALMERLGIHDVAGLTLFAARHKLVDVDGAGH